MSTGGKGDNRRPEAQPGAYARGYDAIQWNNSATAQREMGGSSRQVTNSRHSMIGEQKDGGATGATSPSRASGEGAGHGR